MFSPTPRGMSSACSGPASTRSDGTRGALIISARASGLRCYLPAYGEDGPQPIRYFVQSGIRQGARCIEHLAEEAPGGRRQNDAEYIVIGEPLVAELVDILLGDLLGLISDLAREPDDRRVSRIQHLGRLVF